MKMSIKIPVSVRFVPFPVRSCPQCWPLRCWLPAAAVMATAPHSTQVRLPGRDQRSHYDGTSNDLLTAGLGATGLAAGVPPAYADSAQAHGGRAAPHGHPPTTAPCST